MKNIFLVLSLTGLSAMSAAASFHFWQIKEVYRNADGSVQFIELIGTADNQAPLTGQTISCALCGVENAIN